MPVCQSEGIWSGGQGGARQEAHWEPRVAVWAGGGLVQSGPSPEKQQTEWAQRGTLDRDGLPAKTQIRYEFTDFLRTVPLLSSLY